MSRCAYRCWMYALTLLLLSVLASGAARAQVGAAQAVTILPAEQCAGAKQQAWGRWHQRAAGKRASRASANVDVTYYHLQLDLHFDAPYVFGQTRIEGRVVGTPLATLLLDFDDAMQVDSVQLTGGAGLAFTHNDDVLRIALPKVRAVGDRIGVDVFYHGLPEEQGFGAFSMGALPNGDRFAWSLSEPYGARAWWPCKDHPSDKADSVRVTVTVPEELRVGSNGLLVDSTASAEGRVTYDWRSGYPTASYLVSIAAGRYHAFQQTYRRPDSLAAAFGALELPVLHYAYQHRTDALPEGWAQVTDVMAVLEYWFGPYPFAEEKYGHAQFTWRGGMEHQTMSSMGTTNVGLVVHELGHMWFGDAVTLRTWPHLWLNEGFATYAELLYWNARADRYPGTYEQILNLYRDRALEAEGTLVVEDTTSVNTLFDHRRVYSKGAMVLRMLRSVVGDTAFRDLLQAYASDPALQYGTATTADLQRVAEAVAGRDFDTFFRQWVTDGTGHPVYRVNWTAQRTGADYDVTVTVTQEQEPPMSSVEVFEMPVTLAVQTASGEQRVTVRNDRRRQTYTFTVASQPTGVRFDPDYVLLREDPVVVSVGMVPQDPERTGVRSVYPHPAYDQLQARLDMVRSGPVRLALYDLQGRLVRVFLDRRLDVGQHDLAFAVGDLADGVYMLQMNAQQATSTRTVVVLNRP